MGAELIIAKMSIFHIDSWWKRPLLTTILNNTFLPWYYIIISHHTDSQNKQSGLTLQGREFGES